MEKENVLEIEFQPVWDKWAWRVVNQNEEVLKRDNFIDKKIEVMSDGGSPDFVKDTNYLFIRGGNKEGDGIIRICTAEEKLIIERKVKAINEKHGIKRRWRAEEDNEYYYIDSEFSIRSDNDNYVILDNNKYMNGNYFKTKEDAEEYAEYMIKKSLEWHEKRNENEI